jgi:hypothetical protein
MPILVFNFFMNIINSFCCPCSFIFITCLEMISSKDRFKKCRFSNLFRANYGDYYSFSWTIAFNHKLRIKFQQRFLIFIFISNFKHYLRFLVFILYVFFIESIISEYLLRKLIFKPRIMRSLNHCLIYDQNGNIKFIKDYIFIFMKILNSHLDNKI